MLTQVRLVPDGAHRSMSGAQLPHTAKWVTYAGRSGVQTRNPVLLFKSACLYGRLNPLPYIMEQTQTCPSLEPVSGRQEFYPTRTSNSFDLLWATSTPPPVRPHPVWLQGRLGHRAVSGKQSDREIDKCSRKISLCGRQRSDGKVLWTESNREAQGRLEDACFVIGAGEPQVLEKGFWPSYRGST